MTPEYNKEIVIQAWRTFATRDPERVAALFTADAEWIAPRGNATAVALQHTDHMRGAGEIANFICREFGTLFVRNVNIDFRGFYADGDKVVVEERFRATLANGNPYDNEYCFVFTLREGKIAGVREYMDTWSGHRQIFGVARAVA